MAPAVPDGGTAWRFVRASMSVFPLMPPGYNGGDLLLDGGYVNNMPIDVMCDRLGAATVIAVITQDSSLP